MQWKSDWEQAYPRSSKNEKDQKTQQEQPWYDCHKDIDSYLCYKKMSDQGHSN